MANNTEVESNRKSAIEKALKNVCDHSHIDSTPTVVQVDSAYILTHEEVDKFMTAKNVTTDTIRADLYLFADLSKAGVPPEAIEEAMLSSDSHSLTDVINRHYLKWSQDPKTSDTAMSLFKTYPALVTASLIESSFFTFPEEVQPKVVEVLRTKGDQLNFLQKPVKDMISQVQSTLNENQQLALLRFLQALQSLSAITMEPSELQKLIKMGYLSSEDIAYISWDSFKEHMAKVELEPNRAQAIRRQAMFVQIRAEQVWMTMLHGDRGREVFTGKPNVENLSSKQEDSKLPPPSETLADWFGDLDEMACEECNSVTSPAAYLVDLLRMLHAQSTSPDEKEKTLLKLLYKRRPDIGNLQLSCRNTNDLVSYLDLANEVMESAILTLDPNDLDGKNYDIKAFNADDSVSSGQMVEVAQNTQIDVYDKYLSSSVFPSSVFPFEYSRIVLEQYLIGCGSSLAEVREAFWPMHGNASMLKLGEDVLERSLQRAQATDILELSDKDYLALTGEGTWSLLFQGPESFETSPLNVEPPSIPEYWGYGASDTTAMMESTDGLHFIKKQLLPRLEIDFVTLYDILKTGFMAGELTVSLLPEEGSIDMTKSVPTQLEGFRLRGKGGRALTVKDDQICNRLGQFVRIWQRLKWSVVEVDDALRHFAIVGGSSGSVDLLSITPDTLQQLSAIQELARATKWPPKQVIAMWNPGGAYLEEFKVYYTRSTDENTPPTSPEQKSRSLAMFLATIQMTYQDYLLVKLTQDLDDDLDMQSIFVYNRKQSLANCFGVSINQLEPLFELLGPSEFPEKTPELLLKAWRYWQELKANGWDLPMLNEAKAVADPQSAQPSDNLREKTVAFTSQMVRVFVQLLQGNSVKSTQSLSSLAESVRNIIYTTLSLSVEDGLTSVLPKTDPAVLKFLLEQKTEGWSENARADILLAVLSTSVSLDEPYGLTPGGGFVLTNETCEINLDLPQDYTGQIMIGTRIINVSPSSPMVKADSVIRTVEKNVLTQISCMPEPILPKLNVSSSNKARVALAVIAKPAADIIQVAISGLNARIYISNCNKLSLGDLNVLYGPNKMEWEGSIFDKANSYDKIRQNFQVATTKFDFTKFYLALSQHRESTTKPLEELDTATQLPPGFFKTLLDANFPDINPTQLGLVLTERKVLEKLSLQVSLLNRLGLSPDAVKAFMGFSFPYDQSLSSSQNIQPATQVVQLIKAAQFGKGRIITVRNIEDQLRVRRRKALVAYLLQLPYFKNRVPPITDADGLFEFFLIDVQMGACLETSRIKQAISTVQLFVQRCILGLERGIDPTIIDQPRWSWMQKYTLWEANRKVFLYPENWIDPTLRDNKTEAFKSIEAAIMQTNLDEKTVSKMIRTYVHTIDHIASLRVDAMIWVQASSLPDAPKIHTASEGEYHFFARTRNAPYEFYYRSMKFLSHGALPVADWTHWQKIPFDVRTYDTDVTGASLPMAGSYMVPAFRNHRLFLFLPQVMVTVIPPKTPSNSVILTPTGNTTTVGATDVATQSQIKIEIRMSWSEYVEDNWLPPIQAHESLVPPLGTINPQVESFRFLVDPSKDNTSNILIYVFSTPTVPDKKNPPSTTWTETKQIGKFELKGFRHLTVDEPIESAITLTHAPTTTFGRLPVVYTTNTFKTSVLPSDAATEKILAWPYLSRPEPYSVVLTDQPVFWTMDSNISLTNDGQLDQKSLGLVADFVSKEELGSEVWFTLPEFTNKKNQESEIKPPQDDKINDDELSTTLFNPLGSKIKQAVIKEDGLEKIFEIMDEMQLPEAETKKDDKSSQDIERLEKEGKHEEAEKLRKDLEEENAKKPERSRMYNNAFGFFKNLQYCYENGTPYAIYNWELGFHLISLIVERLFSLQQFDLAIKYAHFVFDPTLAGIKGKDVWRFPPFRSTTTRKAGTIDALFDGLTATSGSDKDKTNSLLQWEKHPFMPHIVARSRPLAYMKRFVMKYIEILIASGDKYFRQPSMEAIPLAIQRYIEASHVLGGKPQKIPRVGDVQPKTYQQLAKDINNFSNAAVQFHLRFPYTLPARSDDVISPGALPGWALTRYFGVQSNHQFTALRDLVDDRLQKIRNCLDIEGNPRKLPLFDPPIDPGALVRAAASNTDLGSVLDAFQGPLPKQRFMYLLQKAQELCMELRQMANTFLLTIEKREGEGLQLLRATHDTNLQTFLIDMRTKEKKEAEKGIEQLVESRRSVVARLKFYSDLAGEKQKPPDPDSDFEEIDLHIPEPSMDDLRLTSHELMELEMADTSHALNGLAINQDFWAALLSKIPMPCLNVQPMGIGVSTQMPNLGDGFQNEASRLRAEASMAMEVSQRGSRMAQFIQQLQERRLQINLAGREIKAIDKQIETQRAHVEVIDHEILSQRKQAEDAAAAEEFLRSKFTRTELYGWLEGTTRQLMHQMYDLSTQLARQAEKCFAFETGETQTYFINAAGYWDGSTQGIDAGDNLWLALKRMELAYEQGRYYDFEISKDVSLRQVSAQQLIKLRRTGTAEFILPEALFDLDFPGHYRRRIKSVAMSLHCISGPYISANATLSLTKHSQRITDRAEQNTSYMRKDPDDRFGESGLAPPISAIAISTGQMDSGVFELDFRGRDYQPFEGAGAISTWTLSLPAEYRQFDYDTISDVVLHLRYTSKGSENLRGPAIHGLGEYLMQTEHLSQNFGMNMLISVRSDYPDVWSQFAMQMPKDNANAKRLVQLSRLRNRLPYFLRARKDLVVSAISFYVSFTGGKPNQVSILANVNDTSNSSSSVTLTEVTDNSPGAIDQNMTIFQWSSAVKPPPEPNTNLVNLLADESASLTFALDFAESDPGSGQQALVVLEYQIKKAQSAN